MNNFWHDGTNSKEPTNKSARNKTREHSGVFLSNSFLIMPGLIYAMPVWSGQEKNDRNRESFLKPFTYRPRKESSLGCNRDR